MRTMLLIPLLLAASTAAAADVLPIGPFVGDRSDPLNYGFTLIAAEIPIFENTALLRSFNGGTSIHLLVSSQLGGDLVTARTGQRILGFTTGPGVFEFDPPVRRFGSWFNNNSGADDATIDFHDAAGNVFASLAASVPVAGNTWTWNGWESDEPIASITVTGNGLIDGFIWFDDLQLSYIPEPATLAGMALLLTLRRR